MGAVAVIVPFCDLGRESRALEAQLNDAAFRVIRSGRFLYGPELEAFEREIAEWHGVKYAVGVASGTDAVEIALRANGMVHVSTTAMTAVPTVNAIEASGVSPGLVDPRFDTRNVEGYALGVAVHLYGLASDATGSFVEDVAHAMGATVGGRLAGTMGRCGALSFYPSKILGACGDGGAIITNDPDIADRARRIRHYGRDVNGDVSSRGQNSRLSEMQAALLRVKLPYVHSWIDRRREIAARYNAELAGKVRVPFEPRGRRAVFHVYVVESDERDQLAARLMGAGVQTMVHYDKAIHEHPRWRHLGEPGQFPDAELLARTVLSLPCYPYLTDEEQTEVIKAVKENT